MRTAHLRFLAVALALAACDQEPRVEGEWSVRLVLAGPGTATRGAAGQVLEGTMVIDRRVPDTYRSAEGVADVPPFVPGRFYLDRRWRDSTAARTAYRFEPGLAPDLFEEALAHLDSAGAFTAHLMPGVTHIGYTLRGRVSAGRITGEWKQDAHVGEVGAHGTFAMWRTRRTAITDSALVRSRPARQEWAEHRSRRWMCQCANTSDCTTGPPRGLPPT